MSDDPIDLTVLPEDAVRQLLKSDAFGTAPAPIVQWLEQHPRWWRDQLVALRTELNVQLSARQVRDKAWERKVKPLAIRLDARLSYVNRLIKDTNREKSESEYHDRFYALLAAVKAHQVACPDTDDPDDIELYRTAAALETPLWPMEVARMREVHQATKAVLSAHPPSY